MTFNLLLLNEFPDEEADREGGRRNLVLLFGRRVGAAIFVGAGLLVPTSIGVAIGLGTLPLVTLFAALPTFLLLKPFHWALVNWGEKIDNASLAANVVWNLSTNALIALTLIVYRLGVGFTTC
jgi:1,4-dihydroxy-2-naphthoate octaprenyltransferase